MTRYGKKIMSVQDIVGGNRAGNGSRAWIMAGALDSK
jgi:hypothetical protein